MDISQSCVLAYTLCTRQLLLLVCLAPLMLECFGRGGELVIWVETCLRGGTRSSLGQLLSFLRNCEQGGALVLRRGHPFGGRDARLRDGPEGVHDGGLLWLMMCLK